MYQNKTTLYCNKLSARTDNQEMTTPQTKIRIKLLLISASVVNRGESGRRKIYLEDEETNLKNCGDMSKLNEWICHSVVWRAL